MALTGRTVGPGARRLLAVGLAVTAGAVALGGCAGQEQSGTPAQRVATWTDSVGGSGIGNVEVATRNVDLALHDRNSPAAVREVCSLLSNEAQTSIGNLPAPDDRLTTLLNDAYTLATAAGDDCYHGAAGDARLLTRSAAERARVLVQLAGATEYVRSVTGHTPTTNTTAPQPNGDPFAGGN
jgi:hypothetical protein